MAEGNTNSYAAAYSALSGEAYVAVAVTFVDGTSDVIYLRVNNATSSSATFYNPSVDDDSDEVIGTQKITTGYGVIDAGWYSYTVNTQRLLHPEGAGRRRDRHRCRHHHRRRHQRGEVHRL